MSSATIDHTAIRVASQPAYRRYAWVLLLLMHLLILLILMSGEAGPVGPGSVLHAFQSTSASETTLELRLRGTVVLGMVIFGLAILLNAYRRGEPWAWYAMWYIPLFFVLHIIAFGTVLPDAVFLAIAALGLLLPYRLFFPQRQDICPTT